MSAQALQEFFVSLGFEVDTAKINEFEQQTARLRDEMLKIGTVITVRRVIGMFVTTIAQGIDELGDFAEMKIDRGPARNRARGPVQRLKPRSGQGFRLRRQ